MGNRDFTDWAGRVGLQLLPLRKAGKVDQPRAVRTPFQEALEQLARKRCLKFGGNERTQRALIATFMLGFTDCLEMDKRLPVGKWSDQTCAEILRQILDEQ